MPANSPGPLHLTPRVFWGTHGWKILTHFITLLWLPQSNVISRKSQLGTGGRGQTFVLYNILEEHSPGLRKDNGLNNKCHWTFSLTHMGILKLPDSIFNTCSLSGPRVICEGSSWLCGGGICEGSSCVEEAFVKGLPDCVEEAYCGKAGRRGS